jgi:DNA-binding MarR family transcriptional regulator
VPGEDSIDRHVQRWAGWDALELDEDVEAVVTRIQRINAYLQQTTAAAVAEVGLDLPAYRTLHRLMIRDTPGYATIGDLARASRVSPAAMTSRVDALEAAGLVRRKPCEDDRRRIEVEATDAGYDRWLRATRLRGRAEHAALAELSAVDRRQLATQLRRLVLTIEGDDPAPRPGPGPGSGPGPGPDLTRR